MTKKLIAIIIVCFMSFGFQLQGCRAQEDDRMIEWGPDVPAELVFFFKKETTWKEILEFQRTVIAIPAPNGTGSSSLPGMMSVVKIDINGFEGQAINFQPSATDEQKAFVKKRVSESPLVYKVYENVIPNQIKDLPSTSKDANERINVMSPDVPAELVFFFKKGTDWKEILEFHRTTIGIADPRPNSSGHSLLPGMMTIVKIDISGFEGEAINFQPDATDEEKAFAKKRVSESPLVYKVYENVIPNQIKDLPAPPKDSNSAPDLKQSKTKQFRPAPTPSP